MTKIIYTGNVMSGLVRKVIISDTQRITGDIVNNGVPFVWGDKSLTAPAGQLALAQALLTDAVGFPCPDVVASEVAKDFGTFDPSFFEITKEDLITLALRETGLRESDELQENKGLLAKLKEVFATFVQAEKDSIDKVNAALKSVVINDATKEEVTPAGLDEALSELDAALENVTPVETDESSRQD